MLLRICSKDYMQEIHNNKLPNYRGMPAQTSQKSYILFHKKCQLQDFVKGTLSGCDVYGPIYSAKLASISESGEKSYEI